MTIIGNGWISRPEPWMDRGLCAQTDPDAFFPDKGGNNAAAISVCNSCPVRAECLTYALAHNELGVWGGTTERQRRRLRAKARQHDEPIIDQPDANTAA